MAEDEEVVMNTQSDIICPRCDGKGYTKAEAPVVIKHNGEFHTTFLGSGCTLCLGQATVSADTANVWKEKHSGKNNVRR